MTLSNEDPAKTLHAVLVEPEIHWNTGNVGRTCLAAGAQLHLVEPLGFDLDDRRVRRAGLDYWSRVDPRVWPSWETLEGQLSELGTAFFLDPGAPREIWDVEFPAETVLVFGRESVGLPKALLEKNRHRTVALPMVDPELRSLNLSTSVALALYEVLRQQRKGQEPGRRESGAPSL